MVAKTVCIALPKEYDAMDLMLRLSKKLNMYKIRMYLDTDYFYDTKMSTFKKNNQDIQVRLIDNIPHDLTIRLHPSSTKKAIPRPIEEHVYSFPIEDVENLKKSFSQLGIKLLIKKKSLTFDDIDMFLLENKIVPKIVIEKRRSAFQYKNSQICYDDVKNLGEFIVINSIKGNPEKTAKQLNLLSMGKHTTKNYREMVSSN